MTTPSIIAYFPITTPPTISGPTNYGPLVNHRFSSVYTMSSGSDAASGLRKHDAWPNGDELYARVLVDVGNIGAFTPWTLLYNSQLLAFSSGSSNSSAVLFATQRNVNYGGKFGEISSSLDPSGGKRMLSPASMIAINDRGVDIIVTTTVLPSHEINSVNMSTQICTNLGAMTETRGVLGALPDGSGTTAFCIGHNDADTTQAISLYLVKLVDLGGFTLVATVAPAAIASDWGHIDAVYGIAIDQTDSNPLFFAQNLTDSVTHTAYLVKLDGATADVLWTCPAPNGTVPSPGDMQQALITKQRFYFLASNQQTVVIDTSDGSILELQAASALTLSPNHPSQVSEDVTGSIYVMGGWAESSTHPNYYGSYMGTGGHHSVGNAPLRYFPDLSDPSPPPPAIEASSRQRTWTFTLDGHKFYVLDLGTQGTLLYDTGTKSWAQFVTTGYFNWNFRNGTTWGQRIVGGDTDTPQIYEMSPSSMLDGGTLPIVHISTGALIKRTRTYSSLASVRLSLSVGQLDDATGATVLLEFSDDQGKTWTAMNTVALVEGDFNQEIAWQGLGSFAAPGRIFRITDIGGFLRIDGCDAELDDFDEDGNSQARDDGQ